MGDFLRWGCRPSTSNLKMCRWQKSLHKTPVTHQLPSGYVKIAIENGHRNSGFSHKKWWFSIAMLVYQRVLTSYSPVADQLLTSSHSWDDPPSGSDEARTPVRDLQFHGRRNLWGSRSSSVMTGELHLSNCLNMGMAQYLLYNTIFSGMNIHLPAILMWTEGVQDFDTLPYRYLLKKKTSAKRCWTGEV
jgi:hypothetical protein